jgi:tRNA G37 N-methylase TrmD
MLSYTRPISTQGETVPEIVYCSDYEEITGLQKPASDAPVVETKVIDAPPPVEVAPATAAETA